MTTSTRPGPNISRDQAVQLLDDLTALAIEAGLDLGHGDRIDHPMYAIGRRASMRQADANEI